MRRIGAEMSRLSKLARFAWVVLGYNILVIVFGAFVRATGSGAGCGSHWPTCNGSQLIPEIVAVQTLIEFTHRITSAVTVVLIIALIIWTWRSYPRKSVLRWTSGAMGLFIVTESLLGAGLVLFNLVDKNASILRAVSMMAHLINTFVLLASISLTAWWCSVGEPTGFRPDRKYRWLFGIGIAAMMLLGASGAIAALGDTLFPSKSLLQGLEADFAAASNYLIRLRIFHPGIAILTGLFAGLFAFNLNKKYPSEALNKITLSLIGLIVFQLVLGSINVLLLAPVWIQLIHLLVTCLIWILYLLAGVLGLVPGYLAVGVTKK